MAIITQTPSKVNTQKHRKNIDFWRSRWEAAGADCIPLQPNDKRPVCKSWQTRAPSEQWAEVGAAFAGNVGVRLGRGLAVGDCDAVQTLANLEGLLAGLGLRPDRLPVVATATAGHRHVLVRLEGAPEGTSRANFRADVGRGHLAWGPGSQVAEPCSVVDGRAYRFTRNGPEALRLLPPLRWADLAALLPPVAVATRPKVATSAAGWLEVPPVRLLWRELPKRAAILLTLLATAPKGEPVTIPNGREYASRSEAECGIVAMCILSGWGYAEVRELFTRWQPGHWREQKNPARALHREYCNVLAELAANPLRRTVADVYRAAEAWPWAGRGGLLERAVYLGLLAEAWKWDTWRPSVSRRTLAEYAACGLATVGRALGRLQESGLVERATVATYRHGATWDLEGGAFRWLERSGAYSAKMCQNGTLVPYKREREAVAPETWAARAESDAGGWAELVGRSAGAVWRCLGGDPLGAAELAERTGKSRRTIYRALDVLTSWDGSDGQTLAVKVAGGWVRGTLDLADVAAEVDADGRAEQRREEHKRQREGWAAVLAR